MPTGWISPSAARRRQLGHPGLRGSGNDWTVEQAGSGLAIRIRHVGDGQLLTVRQAGP
jgi:hypothetical protein